MHGVGLEEGGGKSPPGSETAMLCIRHVGVQQRKEGLCKERKERGFREQFGREASQPASQEINRQTDKQTDRQTDRQTDKQR